MHSFRSTGAVRLNRRIVGIATTPGSAGYWQVGATGAVRPFGTAARFVDPPALSRAVVGAAPFVRRRRPQRPVH